MSRSEYDEHGCRTAGAAYDTGGPVGDEDRQTSYLPTLEEIAAAAAVCRAAHLAERLRGQRGGPKKPSIRVCGNGVRRRGKGKSVNG